MFGHLKNGSSRSMLLDPHHPGIGEDEFLNFDWEEFYRSSEELIPMDMPYPRGK